MTSYAPIPDQRVVEATERALRELRIAAALAHDAGPTPPQPITERIARHHQNAREHERQAKALQVPT